MSTQLVWLNRLTGFQPFHLPQRLCNQKKHTFKNSGNHDTLKKSIESQQGEHMEVLNKAELVVRSSELPLSACYIRCSMETSRDSVKGQVRYQSIHFIFTGKHWSEQKNMFMKLLSC